MRFGSRISPAMKVALFQASAENSEPTIATAIAATSGMPSEPTPPSIATGKAGRDQFACHDSARAPSSRPHATSASTAAILARVKLVWIQRPPLMPRLLTQVRKSTSAIDTSCAALSLKPPKVAMTFWSPRTGYR